jgi:Phosphatidate phosphatase APP1, catalytic domain
MNLRAPSSVNPTTQRIQALMRGHTDRAEEAEILQLLGDADRVTLNESITQLDLPELFSDVDDHWGGPKNKTRLLQMLSQDRLEDLEIPSRSAVVGGLQEGWTRMNEGSKPLAGGVEEQSIRDIILGTHGPDLTTLKNQINAGADEYDMHHLLHSDVDDQGFRTQIFTHFAEQAQTSPSGQVKPLSDIDDTFYSNLKDERYPSETVYPGVLAFYDELDKGARVQPDRLGDLTFLSARPDESSGTIKNRTHQTLRQNGIKDASILLGSLTGLINNETMARKKMENFEQYTAIYPEYDFTWTGDSGQGDAILGQRMLEQHPNKVKGVFIHNVTGLSSEEKQAFRQQGVRVFDTYVGAAVEAFELGLITREGLQRVAQAASTDLEAIPWESDEQKQARVEDLDRDLARIP